MTMPYEMPEVAVAEVPEAPEPLRGGAALGQRRASSRGQSMLDDVANDLALWIDETATEVALGFSPARAPFSAQITEQQKLEFYKNQIFLPDGSPNQAGRQQQIARLGAEGFGQVYKAVVSAYPNLKPPPAPEVAVPEEWPTTAPVGPPPGPPMMPPGAGRGAGLPVAGLGPPGPPPPVPLVPAPGGP
jgi:hypothetical protein